MPRSKSILILLTLFLVLIAGGFIWSGYSHASAPDLQEEPTLRVVTKEIPPFVIKEQDRLTGFSIDLWKEVALITDLPFEFVEVETVSDQLGALADGEADLALAAISLTPEREERFDFSYPYFRSGLQIMTISQRPSLLGWFFNSFLTGKVLLAIAFLALILIAIGHLVWFFERKDNTHFPMGYVKGVWEGMWWAAVTVTTVGYGDRTIKGVPGRLIGIFWMFAGIFLIGGFTAYVAAELTVAEFNAVVNGPDDLKGKQVITLEGTTSADYLRSEGIPFQAVETIDDAYQQLKNGSADAIVYDSPVLQYYAATGDDGRLVVVGSPFQREDYGIAYPPGSPYEEQINRALLLLKANGTYDEISKRWFISEDG